MELSLILAVLLFFILISSCNNYEYNKLVFMDKDSTIQLKGVAIIFVILAHMKLMYYFDAKAIGNFGAIGVDIFLMLSGYGVYKSYKKRGVGIDFILRRLKKIYTPLIIVVLLELVWRIYGEKSNYSIHRIITFFTGFDTKRTLDGTYWYISFILLWYAIFFIIYRYSKHKKISIILLFCFSYLFKVSKFISPIGDLSWQYSLHFISFPFGILVATYERNIIELLNKDMYKLIIIVLVIGSISSHYVFSGNSEYYWLYDINVSMIFIFLGVLLQSLGFMSKFLKSIGNISYEVYLVEMQILTYLNLTKLIGNKFVGDIAEIMFCFIAGYALNKFIDKFQILTSNVLKIIKKDYAVND
ncbi:acyltransferase family protein [Clostridium neuense]|uniref:Acyltransferase family protein n=1 Tax=Clostridium neuense TaxID=1728934 RepID=A0ABW8TKW6_9CLOT